MAYDFVNARRIVNGTDKAQQFANWAAEWLRKIPSLVPASPTSLYLAERPTSAPTLALTPLESPLIPSEILDSAYLALNVAEAPMGRDGRPAMPTYSSTLIAEPVALAEWIAANFAFLDVIAQAVGTYQLGTEAWRAIEGGGTMNDTQAHPGNGKRAGKFFLTESQWQKAKAADANIKDFSQDGQLGTAIRTLRDLGSYLDDLKAGQYAKIFGYAKQGWPELPGGTRQRITQAEADTFFRRRITEIQNATNQASPTPTPSPSPVTPSPSPTPAPLVDPTPGQGVPGRVLSIDEMRKFCQPGVLFLTMYYKSKTEPNDESKDLSYHGTAFLVESRGTFVTVAHNWGAADSKRGEFRKVIAQTKDWFDKNIYYPSRFLFKDDNTDVAIGEIDPRPNGTRDVFPVLQVAANFDIKVGATVYCQGNSDEAGDRPWDITSGRVQQLGSPTAKLSGGYVGQFQSIGNLGNSGDSGAPVWDQRGVVYGVHSNSESSSNKNQDENGATRSDVIRSFFRSKMGRDIPAPQIGQVAGATLGNPGLPPLSGGGTSPIPTAPKFTGNGTPISIAIGNWDSPTATIFNFSYTAIDVEMSGLPIVTITGKSVKWNTTKANLTAKTYQGASLFDIAAAIAAESGVQLKIEGTVDPVVPYASQPADGGNRQFLAALAKEYGYRLREYDSVVTLSPQTAAYDTKFIVTYGMTSSLKFGDAADSQRILLRDSFSTVGSKQQPPTIDLATGRIEYPKTIESVLPSATRPPDGAQIGRGYESTIELQLTDETLNLKPGDLIWLDYSLAPNPFARDWRVNRVTHTLGEDGGKTSLSIYLPVYIQQQGQTQASPTPSPGTPSPAPGLPAPAPSLDAPGSKKLTPQQIFDQYADAVIYINGDSIGTGFIVTTEGHFLSANHVVSNANSKIQLKDGTNMTYSIVGTNSNRDMTVGKLNNYTKGKVCWLAKTADSEAPNGSTVTAIGHPLDKRWTLTSAPRTGTSKCLSYRGNTQLDCIKTGPSLVDRGNSGGPIFNDEGLVVGMAASQSQTEDGATKIEHLRSYFLEVVGKAIPDPAPIIATPVPAPVPTPAPSQVTPPPVVVTPPPSSPPQGSVTSEAQLENLTSLRMINPEPGTRTTSAFGWRIHPIQGNSRLHRGTDCARGKGTKILAAAAGKVIKIGGVSGYGDYNVVVYHGTVAGQKIYGMYAHGSNLQVKLGQFVKQGDWIVSEDTLGMSTGSHLHFGTTINYNWGSGNYPPNSPNVWYDPIKNFITSTFTGTINTDGVLNDGKKGGNMPT